tara:strand:- start:667 stop:840 length:174 start_codon:yes stop_codon:yes gene_type:complete
LEQGGEQHRVLQFPVCEEGSEEVCRQQFFALAVEQGIEGSWDLQGAVIWFDLDADIP